MVSGTTQLKLESKDGKKYRFDVLNNDEVIIVLKNYPSRRANKFLEWFINSEDLIDGKSKSKAYSLFSSSLLESIEVGTIKGLQQIHSYLFGGLYDAAGKIRDVNISKGNFTFAPALYLENSLLQIEKMSENNYNEIINKYVEMNVAHPFREGNGRSTRIWLDLMLKKNLGLCIDWSKVKKKDYLNAMILSPSDSSKIKLLLKNALTDKINDREMFMKGIDYSYYYEE